MSADVGIATLIGETLTAIHGMEPGSDRVTFETASGRSFVMLHHDDCCESVSVNEVVGDVADLIGAPILKAEESSNSEDDKPDQYSESWTWTFYHLATLKGYVTLRWLGASNGYYSESVDFEEVR